LWWSPKRRKRRKENPPGEAKVAQLAGVCGLLDEDVLCLNISVNDARLMEVLERNGDLD